MYSIVHKSVSKQKLSFNIFYKESHSKIKNIFHFSNTVESDGVLIRLFFIIIIKGNVFKQSCVVRVKMQFLIFFLMRKF